MPGRLERFVLPQGALAVVDYAHTPDALAAVLRTCASWRQGRLLAGLRLRRRPGPGQAAADGRGAAAQGADLVWITSDNPRSEDPAAICAEIEAGCRDAAGRRAAACEVVVDRQRGHRRRPGRRAAGTMWS